MFFFFWTWSFFKEHTYWVIEEITIFLTFYFLIKYNYLQCCVTQCCVSFWCVAERFILFYILFHYICYRILNIVPSAIWRTLLYICLGSGTPLQYFCLENPMDGGAWYAAVHGVTRVGHGWVTSLSLFTFMHWRRKWQPTPVFLPGESQGRGSLVGCRLWGRTELDMAKAMQQQQCVSANPKLLIYSSPSLFPLW